MSQQKISPEYVGMARTRWPEYEIEGAGGIAVVFHCCKKVVLVDYHFCGGAPLVALCGHAIRPHGGYFNRYKAERFGKIIEADRARGDNKEPRSMHEKNLFWN